MPTYEYACLSCGHHIEVYQRFSDEPLTVCGVCGGPLRKVFHPAGILFKGSGFYATDSRSSRSGADKGDSRKAGSEKTASDKAGATKSEPASSAGPGGKKEDAGKAETGKKEKSA
jgi:putative FmdB family regulatory protein